MLRLDDETLDQVVGGLTAIVAINSPMGSTDVAAPTAAIPGVLNAFTQVITQGPGDLSNIDVVL